MRNHELKICRRSFPKLKIPHQSHADFCSTDTAGGLDNKKRRYASRGGGAYRLFLWGFPKGATPPFGTRLCEAKCSVLYALPALPWKCRCRRGGQGHLKRQENRAVLAWRGAASAGLDSSADRAYMKAPVPRPTLQLVDKVSRSCGHTPGKVAGQRATVKAEMNGFTPGLDLRPLSRWMGGQGGQSLKVLGRSLSDFEVFSFSKWQIVKFKLNI